MEVPSASCAASRSSAAAVSKRRENSLRLIGVHYIPSRHSPPTDCEFCYASVLMNASARTGKAFALLAATLFLLVVASFHSAADNDLGRINPGHRVALFSSASPADTCAACTLDGILSARLSLTVPVVPPQAVEIVTPSIPSAPFVSPRASVESRPPPSIA